MKKYTPINKRPLLAVIALAVALAALVNSAAQTPSPSTSADGGSPQPSIPAPSDLPIHNPGAFRESALKVVVSGRRWVYASTMDWNYSESVTNVEAEGHDAEEVLDRLFSVVLKYRVFNPEDKVYGYVQLYDNHENVIFLGSAVYTGASLEDQEPTYIVWLQRLSLFNNVRAAEVLALDDDGTTGRRYPVEISQAGQLLFETWMVGALNGLLVVRFSDGAVVTYRLNNSVGTALASLAEDSGWSIPGHYVYRAADKPLNADIVATWEDPTILFRGVVLGQRLMIDVRGVINSRGEIRFVRPQEMTVTGSFGWRGVPLEKNGPTRVVIDDLIGSGDVRIRFDWTGTGFLHPMMLYIGPPDSGGQG